LTTKELDRIVTCGTVGIDTTAPPVQPLSDVDTLTMEDPTSPHNWNRPSAPRKDVPEVLVFVGNAPSSPKLMDSRRFSKNSNTVPATPMDDTTEKQRAGSKQNYLMSDYSGSLEIHGLQMVAEERGFAVGVARNVWERCRDVETTLAVLEAMRDAANRVCAAAVGRAPIT
jgi:hypothetical protein